MCEIQRDTGCDVFLVSELERFDTQMIAGTAEKLTFDADTENGRRRGVIFKSELFC